MSEYGFVVPFLLGAGRPMHRCSGGDFSWTVVDRHSRLLSTRLQESRFNACGFVSLQRRQALTQARDSGKIRVIPKYAFPRIETACEDGRNAPRARRILKLISETMIRRRVRLPESDVDGCAPRTRNLLQSVEDGIVRAVSQRVVEFEAGCGRSGRSKRCGSPQPIIEGCTVQVNLNSSRRPSMSIHPNHDDRGSLYTTNRDTILAR